MPRGNRTFYDPILQTPGQVEGAADLSRIELFPVGQESTSRLPEEIGKWVARCIEADGSISGYTDGDFNHDAALQQAQDTWPGLTVYELNAEIEDSTWEGTGPSPRLWQNLGVSRYDEGESIPPAGEQIKNIVKDAFAEDPQATMAEVSRMLYAFSVGQPGTYVRLEDILVTLEDYAAQFDQENNPSAALGLREAARALGEPF